MDYELVFWREATVYGLNVLLIDLFLQTHSFFCLSMLHLLVFLFNIESRKNEKTSKCNYIIFFF